MKLIEEPLIKIAEEKHKELLAANYQAARAHLLSLDVLLSLSSEVLTIKVTNVIITD